MVNKSQKGFTLIELVAVIVIAGILAAVALQQLTPIQDNALYEGTCQEMDRLAFAITGNPELISAGSRSDFGYIDDVGALPPNLDALVTNPGLTTWNGPYIKNSFEQMADDYKKDSWQVEYVYTGGTAITSTGSGDNIVRSLAGSINDLLYNNLAGNIYDYDGTPPGTNYFDSIEVQLIYPKGAAGMNTEITTPDKSGYFAFDSIPIGQQELKIIYLPTADTLRNFVCITPGSDLYSEYRLASDVWVASVSAPTPESGPIAHWKLDDGNGNTATDDTDNNNDGTLQNMIPGHDWVTGHLDLCLDFDGYNDHVEVSYDPLFDLADAYTICGWFQIDWGNRNDYRSIISKEVTYTDRNWWVCVRGNGTLWWKLSMGGMQISINPSDIVADGTWHHFAAVFDGDAQTCNLYIDGTVPTGGTVTGISYADTQNRPVYIGDGYTSGRDFKGLIDDIRIYDRALSASEVADLASE